MKLCAFASLALFAVAVVGDAPVAPGSKEWGYREHDANMYGPSQWGIAFPKCNGSRQSPIDITTGTCGEYSNGQSLQFDGECTAFKMKQTSDSYKGEVQSGTCTVAANSAKYSMLQFHIHSPSEHTVDGKVYDAEAHFVHRSEDGSKLLVVGLFLQKEANANTDPWLASVWNTLSNVNSNKTTSIELGSYASVLQSQVAKGHLYNYPGSLTTPSCDEIVDWWVIETPLAVSPEDFDQFQQHLARLPVTDKGNGARPVQPLNGREISIYSASNRSFLIETVAATFANGSSF
ncbi:TPA: hypothetical protein N0F65_001751 [Lagenidium giganteum]|uniref:Carbonic anhydrase n=1 Tax=Lagenidium giganteum TaxID=4803 RepID=A0AAV2Z1A9_9STRA|nr:TPA: hypothetical protein N0F65_001751 [Lagenidium giganteum]